MTVGGALATNNGVVLLNKGEVGAGVTTGTAGLEIDRGVADNYSIVFDEASAALKVGTVGSLQKVATREDAPIDGGFAVWDGASGRFTYYTDT